MGSVLEINPVSSRRLSYVPSDFATSLSDFESVSSDWEKVGGYIQSAIDIVEEKLQPSMNEPNSEEEGNADSQQGNSSLSQHISARVEFTGPIPLPETLEQYNRILPSAADRIISMAEREQEHRHKMQEKLVDSQVLDKKQERTEKRLEQVFGLTIGVVTIIAGSATVVLNSSIAGEVAGGLIGSSGVIGLVSVFVLGRREQKSAQYAQLESSDIEDEAGSI